MRDYFAYDYINDIAEISKWSLLDHESVFLSTFPVWFHFIAQSVIKILCYMEISNHIISENSGLWSEL